MGKGRCKEPTAAATVVSDGAVPEGSGCPHRRHMTWQAAWKRSLGQALMLLALYGPHSLGVTQPGPCISCTECFRHLCRKQHSAAASIRLVTGTAGLLWQQQQAPRGSHILHRQDAEQTSRSTAVAAGLWRQQAGRQAACAGCQATRPGTSPPCTPSCRGASRTQRAGAPCRPAPGAPAGAERAAALIA